MRDLFLRIISVILVGSFSVYWIRYGIRIIIFAIKYDIMRAKDRVYLRSMNPLHFWVGIVFHVVGVVSPAVLFTALVVGLIRFISG